MSSVPQALAGFTPFHEAIAPHSITLGDSLCAACGARLPCSGSLVPGEATVAIRIELFERLVSSLLMAHENETWND